ncbi:DUF192 domain-containing protein [Streptomyces sp. NBS 14/10]|uniref:DUF192 domain-containing protein n=1 Tax=Streptomyces sp. NBS 14/10 TaxID=1945643 RepID=UPI000B7F6E2B|nr:DUF192 domain-containing protein [Streptomyces sp. NBS 14/10]KAK1181815.1 DUF192 domain-containing protein [Streptomyces sp. NBS 14/10]
MGRWRDGTGTLRVRGGAHDDVREDFGDVGGGAHGDVRDGAHGGVPGGVLDADVPLEVAASYRARTRGLLGRDGVTGALLLTPASSVHTFGMRFAIDVAYLDRRLTVLAVRTMRPGRLGLPRPRARHVLEAEAGAMERWGLRAGARVTIRCPGA